MYYIPYFKSKRHIIVFILFVLPIVVSATLFIVSLFTFIASGATRVEDDPLSANLIYAMVIVMLISVLTTVLFIVDLILYLAMKRRAKKAKDNNVEVILKDSPITFRDKEQKVRTTINDSVIADVKTEEDTSINYELDVKEEHKPNYKTNLMVLTYASRKTLVIALPIVSIMFFLLCFLLSLDDMVRGCISGGAIALGFLVVFAILYFLLPLFMTNSQKKLHPEEVGIRIYEDNIEYYMHVNQEIKGQHINAVLKTKFNFSKAKHKETKNHILIKQKVIRQTTALAVNKNEADPRLLTMIKEKFKEYSKNN